MHNFQMHLMKKITHKYVKLQQQQQQKKDVCLNSIQNVKNFTYKIVINNYCFRMSSSENNSLKIKIRIFYFFS